MKRLQQNWINLLVLVGVILFLRFIFPAWVKVQPQAEPVAIQRSLHVLR